MELNKVYRDDCLHFMRQLSAASLPLVIADPPYYHVKGAFDFLWSSYAAYLTWCHDWLKECARVLRVGGALLLLAGHKQGSRPCAGHP